MIGVPLLQFIEHQVHRVLKLLIILPDLHRIDELNESGEILFLHRGLVVDITNERTIQKRFRFDPEIIPGLAFPLRIRN